METVDKIVADSMKHSSMKMISQSVSVTLLTIGNTTFTTLITEAERDRRG